MMCIHVAVGAPSVLAQDARPAPADGTTPVLVFVGVPGRHLVPVSTVRVVLTDAVAGAATTPVLQLGDRFQVIQTDTTAVRTGGPTETRGIARVAKVVQFVAGWHWAVGLLPHQHVGTHLSPVAHRAAAISLVVDVARPRMAALVGLVCARLVDKLRERGHDGIIVIQEGN